MKSFLSFIQFSIHDLPSDVRGSQGLQTAGNWSTRTLHKEEFWG